MSHDMSEVKLILITLLSKVINYEYSPLTGYAYRGVRNLVFFKQEVPGMLWGTQTVAWARLDKILTPGFYNYLKNTAKCHHDTWRYS